MQKIVSEYLKLLSIPISKKYTEKLILSHPEYPYLISIADSFDKLGIKSDIFKIEKEYLSELEFPYLLYLDKNGGEVISISSERDLKGNRSEIMHWTGIIIQAEKTELILDEENNNYLSRENYLKRIFISCTIIFLILTGVATAYNFSWFKTSLIITNILGISISLIIIGRELGFSSKTIDSFCLTGKGNSCDRVLKSYKGKVSLSEIALAYFSLQFTAIFWSGFMPNEVKSILFCLIAMGTLTIPVILFSIYYQHFKVKSWCRFCLTMTFILLFQIIIYCFVLQTLQDKLIDNFNLYIAIIGVLIFLFLSILITFINSILRELFELRDQVTHSDDILSNPAIFRYYLVKNKLKNTNSYESDFKIGSNNASLHLTLIVSLYCDSCKDFFQTISELLALHPNEFSLTIRFAENRKSLLLIPSENRYIIQYFIENIKNKDDFTKKTIQMMNDWYVSMDFKKFMRKYPLESINQLIGLENEKNDLLWINDNQINKVPAIFINEFIMPNQYKIKDLKKIIPSIFVGLYDKEMI